MIVFLNEIRNEKCAVVDQHLRTLAARYPAVKFLRGEVSLCVPDFPDSNLPTLVIYFEGDVKTQYVGAKALGGHPCSIKGHSQNYLYSYHFEHLLSAFRLYRFGTAFG